jgi:importin subunit alpha-1
LVNFSLNLTKISLLSKNYSRQNHSNGDNLSLIRNISWCLNEICNGKDPYIELNHIEVILPSLADLIYSNDDETLINTSMAISFLAEHKDSSITNKKIIEIDGMCRRLVELLKFPNDEVSQSVLRVLGDLVSGEDDKQIQVVLDSGLLTHIFDLLDSPKKNVRKEVCFVLSNIAAGNEKQIQVILRPYLRKVDIKDQ